MSMPSDSTQNESPNIRQPVNLAHLPALAQAIAGSIGSVVSNALVYPIDLVTTRMQTRPLKTKASRPRLSRQQSQACSEISVTSTKSGIRRKKNYSTVISSIQTILSTEPNGIQALYSGILVDSSATFISSFLYFYVYTTLQKLANVYKKKREKKAGALEATLEELIMGSMAGMIAKFVTCPLSNITVRLQTSRSKRAQSSRAPSLAQSHTEEQRLSVTLKVSGLSPDALAVHNGDSDTSQDSELDDDSGSQDPTFLSTLRQTIDKIYEERGYQGFWSGYGNNCVLTLNPSLTLYLIKILQHGKPSPGFRATFLHSAIASTLSTILTYPMMLSKTLLQVNGRSSKNNLWYRYKHFGLRAIYTGLEARLLKGFVGQGVTMSVKIQLEKLIVFLYMYRHRKKSQKTS